MNVFLDAHVFDEAGQGSKTYLKGVFTEAIHHRKDINFVLAACDSEGLKTEFGSHPNSSYERYASHNKYYRLALDITSKIRRNKIDVAHFTYISPLFKTCREILALHDLLFLDMPHYFPASYRLTKNYLFKRSAQRAELVTTLSEYSKETIIRYYGIADEKIIITPCGILDLYWAENADDAGIKEKYKVRDYVLYVSRIEPRKNHIALLRAYVELALWKKDIQLVFIGTPAIHVNEFSSFYEALDEKVKGKILFLQNLSSEEVRAFYKNSLLSVYPSLGEGFGIPPLEAAVCGSQVLCSNTTAMREFTFFGDMHFNPNNLSELKEKMTHYITRPLAEDARNKIRDIIKKNYSWQASSETLFNKVSNPLSRM